MVGDLKIYICIYFTRGRSNLLFQSLSVQFSLSVMPNCLKPMDCSIPRFPFHQELAWSLVKLISIKSVMPYNHLSLYPLLLLPSILSSIRVKTSELALRIR